jgi:hypothetical protein
MTRRKSLSGFVAASVLAGVLLWGLRTFDRPTMVEPRKPISEPASGVEGVGLALEAPRGEAPFVERTIPEAPPRTEASIGGVVLLPGDVPSRAGFVFAWLDGLVPAASSLRDLVEGKVVRGMAFAPIRADGSFRLGGLAPGEGHTLGAVARGAICVQRPIAVVPGSPPVTLRLTFTYGVAIRLEERGGRPLRTAAGLFGGGPRASGPAMTLQQNPPELFALGIDGLEEGHGTRDRWQYLAVADTETGAVGPIDYEIEVPGYSRRKEVLYVPRLVERLGEAVVTLEPRAASWGEVSVRVIGQAQVLSLGLDEAQLIGVVYLSEENRDPVEFAVHALALRAPERISGIPSGSYDVYFEATDAYYDTEPRELVIGSGTSSLEFDCSDAGTLFFDVQEDGKPYDTRFVATVEDADGAVFNVTYDSGPYVIPAMFPGTYRVTELQAPGRECASSLGEEIEIFPGRVSVSLVACRGASLAGR